MAFGGSPVNYVPGQSGAFTGFVTITGVTLAARAGAFDPTFVAADSAGATSGTPGAGQIQIPSTFGVGNGNWTVSNIKNVKVSIADPCDSATPSVVCVAAGFPAVLAGGCLGLGFHNTGAATSGTLTICLEYLGVD